MTTKEKLYQKVRESKANSAWTRGVREYAMELIDNWYAESVQISEKILLSGASNWNEYSWGGCAYCYDKQIAERLCAPWELKRTDYGRKKPNKDEEWLDVQARALYQASQLVLRLAREE